MNIFEVVAVTVDLKAVQAKIKSLKAQLGEVEMRMASYLKELGFSDNENEI